MTPEPSPQFPARRIRAAKFAGALLPAAVIGACIAAERDVGGFTTALVARWLSEPAALALGTVLVACAIWRTVLWLRYRPTPALPLESLPSVSIVIPAFNEGSGVRQAILSAAGSRYPGERLEILCIDDGSTDDTFAEAQAACREAGRSGIEARALSLGQNRGKRHALYLGLSLARGEVVVTLDSDSELEPDALRHLVSPLARSEVGAVSGRVLVRNRNANLLTRMLGVQYLLGFDFTRAYQSELGTVFCVPGACAAYRRSVIVPQLEAWRDQLFLGAACTNGDDHHMTNRVLRSGFDVVYQSTATVHTEVPERYGRLTRMFTRWARSNVRESLWYMSFGVQRAWRTRRLLPLLDGVLKVVTNALRPVVFLSLLAGLVVAPGMLLGVLASATIGGGLYALYYLRCDRSSEALFAVLYAYFAVLALQWIYPFATLTVRKNRWLTR